MFSFRKKPEVPKEDVVFTESHSVEVNQYYVGSINVGKNGKFSFEVSPHNAFSWRLTEDRLEKILSKVKELNDNVPVSR